jgi:hypothetical protein
VNPGVGCLLLSGKRVRVRDVGAFNLDVVTHRYTEEQMFTWLITVLKDVAAWLREESFKRKRSVIVEVGCHW